jgi:ribosomal subunit interface protein
MNFQLKCRHMDCPDDLKQAIPEKVKRFEPLVPDQTFMEMELNQLPRAQADGDKEAEVLVDIPGVKPVIRFVCHGETFLEAVDRVLDKLDEELSKRKDKLTDHSYNGEPVKVIVADEVNRDEL